MEHILKQGLVQVYTGDGKGKTTAALGQAMRSTGDGLKVLMVQFLKDKNDMSGELNSADKLTPELRIVRLKQKHPMFSLQADYNFEDLQASVKELFSIAKEAVLSEMYDMIILDEINNVLKERLLAVEDVLNLIKSKPKEVELILTGRNALPEIIEAANLVTEMKKIKHPLDQGIAARKGIEY